MEKKFSEADLIAARCEARNVSPPNNAEVHLWMSGNTLAGRLQRAEDEIRKVARTASCDDWDGEGSDKVAKETVSLALDLVATFPYSKYPDILGDDLDIDATPFGSLDFGWALERDVRMNVLAVSTGQIAFAYSVHGRRDSGKEPWTGNLSYGISEAFDSVFNRKETGEPSPTATRKSGAGSYLIRGLSN